MHQEAAAGTAELRPYQVKAAEQITREIVIPRKRGLSVGPTGCGKTIIITRVIRDAERRGDSILFISHRREITKQTCAKLFNAGVRDFGVIQAGFTPRPSAAIQVASIQTLHARAIRAEALALPPAALIVIDEAHHRCARTYSEVIQAYPRAAVVGLTATPCRGDGRGLGGVFDLVIETPQISQLIAEGYLVPTKVYAPAQPDLSGVRVERGDYVAEQLAERMDRAPLVGDIVEHWLRLGERRRTVAFATSVAHSVHIRDSFREAGVLAEHLDGSTPLEERDEILARLAAGQIEVITNCMVLTEGWDQPEVSCLILARPTRHMGLYRQMVGRGLRPAPPLKSDCLVLDHSGAVFTHGFVEDPVEWTLDPDRRAVSPTHAARGTYNGPPALTTCPECHAIREQGRPCGACGWRPRPKPQPVCVENGELGRVERDGTVRTPVYTEAQKLEFYRQLRGIATERETITKPDGWAAHKFKERFGTFPPFGYRDWGPLPPTPAVRAWEKSRRIAYAKQMETRRAGAAP